MFNKIEELIEDIRHGKIVVLIDDEDRENEGDLILAADHVTSESINFMALEARGLICLSLTKEQVDRLQLPLMVRDEDNETPNKTAFTVSIEAASGVSTGISAADRAHTIKVASQRNAKAGDVRAPGHVFPIRAQNGGVLRRAGHTEGSVDLARLAGLNPAAVICEVMNADGTMARVPDLVKFAKKHGLKIGTIVDLITYRLQNETLIETVSEFQSPEMLESETQVKVLKSTIDGAEHLVFQKGKIDPNQPVLVRVHVENTTADLLSTFLEPNSKLQIAKRFIEVNGGVLVVLRGVVKAPSLSQAVGRVFDDSQKDHSNPATEKSTAIKSMDQRDYGIGAQILRSLGVHQMRLLSNTLEKRVGLKAYGLEIIELIPMTEESYKQYAEQHLGDSSENTQSGSGHFTIQ